MLLPLSQFPQLQQQENHEEEADYVPDFVDLLMDAPLDHGKLYADRDLVSLITVRMPILGQSAHVISLCLVFL